MNKAVFFDRDGIINKRIIDDYVKTIEEFVFIEEFFECFKIVKELGYLTIVVTNQQGIGKGWMDEDDLIKIHHFLQSETKKNTNFQFDDIQYCPDLKSANSFRRKPNPGMILEAVNKFNISTTNSYIIGDSKSDIEAGIKSGLKTILISETKSIDSDYYFENHKEFLRNIKTILEQND